MACAFVETRSFEYGLCAIITINTILIGVECQDIQRPKDREEMYTAFENFFAAIYCLETILRLCHFGFVGYFCPEHAGECSRNWFHFVLALLGAMGMAMSVIPDQGEIENSEIANSLMEGSSVLRCVRVLRIFPMIAILYFLKDLEYVVTTAVASALRCGFLCFMVLFINAVIITHLLSDTEDEIIAEMFGYLSTSMWHLFEVLVDGFGAKHVIHAFGGPQIILITAKVTEVSPNMWMFWVFFVFFGAIALTDLVPSIFVVLNLHEAEVQRKEDEVADWQKRVQRQRAALDKLFLLADVDKSDSVSKQELDDMLQDEEALKKADLHDILEQKADIQMEIERVFDELPPGYSELGHKEFLDVFSRLRSAPISPDVLCLQKEIYNLRSFIRSELAQTAQAAKGRSSVHTNLSNPDVPKDKPASTSKAQPEGHSRQETATQPASFKGNMREILQPAAHDEADHRQIRWREPLWEESKKREPLWEESITQQAGFQGSIREVQVVSPAATDRSAS